MPCRRITRSTRLRLTLWARGTQFGVDTRPPISAPVLGMNPPDIARQFAIGDLARAFRP
jgi:hypothetical protein